ncbi:hypothetical protein KK137_01420 [Croceibacterium sp. LX-88]|uniref:Uncharacterized protein n=1 Tax=Croceibacterium selenioxidans TaxID=2838833 RepID=A0ABS5VZM7_9SPHN|nr:hypothetical protein [Croceibacterium selenioxidans]MBT2132980.1 hypothetical protein [Croceibacterium selenioxidans]
MGRHRDEAERRGVEFGAQNRPYPAEVLDLRVVAFGDHHGNVHSDRGEQGNHVGAGEEAQDHVGPQAIQRPPQNVNTGYRAQRPFDRRSSGWRVAEADDLHGRIVVVIRPRRRFVERKDCHTPAPLHHGVCDNADDALCPASAQTGQRECHVASRSTSDRVARDAS